MNPEHKLHQQRAKTCMSVTENEFEELSRQKMPNWSAVWDILLKESNEMRLKNWDTSSGPLDLHRRIRNKISALVKKEEILVALYMKAAEVAKRKENEFKTKIIHLLEQIEKDKNMLKMFKPETYSSCQF